VSVLACAVAVVPVLDAVEVVVVVVVVVVEEKVQGVGRRLSVRASWGEYERGSE
jgi:hypothetical protein